MRAPSLLLAAALALGCDGPESPPPAPGLDGSVRFDGNFDAGPPPPRRDAGPPGPTLDGVIDEEWDGATCVEAEVETDRPGSELSRLCALIEDELLFVAVEGTLAGGDALTVYLDRALGVDEGIAIDALMDTEGVLDVALSQAVTTPAAFRADAAFGTSLLPRTVVGLDEEAGWRALVDPEELEWIAAEEAPLVCAADACEARIALERLGGEAPRTIALFARIAQATGGLTNQTLPEDDPDAPGVVSALLTIDDGVAMPDGGPPDGGVDAGPPAGLSVDGVIGVDEWAGALEATSSTPPAAPFLADELTRLLARRTATHLEIAIEGTIDTGHAILMYLDAAPGGLFGSPAPLVDFTGALDRALSKELFITDSSVDLDFAWGTLDMSRAISASDDRMGWRDVGSDGGAYAEVDPAMAPSACGAAACETTIPLSALGARASDTIRVFVRLGDATSLAMSNQTLPLDDPGAPAFVSVTLDVAP